MLTGNWGEAFNFIYLGRQATLETNNVPSNRVSVGGGGGGGGGGQPIIYSVTLVV